MSSWWGSRRGSCRTATASRPHPASRRSGGCVMWGSPARGGNLPSRCAASGGSALRIRRRILRLSSIPPAASCMKCPRRISSGTGRARCRARPRSTRWKPSIGSSILLNFSMIKGRRFYTFPLGEHQLEINNPHLVSNFQKTLPVKDFCIDEILNRIFR